MSLSIKHRAIYGAGGVAFSVKDASFSTFVLLYYTQVLGLSGTLTGIVLTIAVAWDAVSDPMIGMYSDRFSSRWGRRLPIMAASIIPMPLGLIALFVPPDMVVANSTYLAMWLLGSSIWLRTATTMFAIPHVAMVPEITKDYHERSQFFSARSGLMFLTAGLLPALSLYFLFGESGGVDGRFVVDNYVTYGFIAAIIVALFSIVTVGGIWSFINKETLQEYVSPSSGGLRGLANDFLSTFRSRNFRNLLCYDFGAAIAYGVIFALNVIAYTYFWEVGTATLGVIMGTGVLFAIPVSMLLQKRVGSLWPKHLLIRYTLIAAIINTVWLFPLRILDVLPENGHWLVTGLLILQFCFLMAFFLFRLVATYSLAADLTDEHELRTGVRQEGGIYSVLMFNSKLAASVGPLYGGFALEFIGLDKGMLPGTLPVEMLHGLVWMLVVGSVPMLLAACFFTYRFSMTQEQLAEIQEQLNQENA